MATTRVALRFAYHHDPRATPIEIDVLPSVTVAQLKDLIWRAWPAGALPHSASLSRAGQFLTVGFGRLPWRQTGERAHGARGYELCG